MQLRVQQIIEFYDVRQADRARHISGITGFIGESLGTSLLIHKLTSDGFTVELLPGTPKTGRRRAPRLDCWVAAQKDGDRRIYQVEIKNWSAYSKGGKDLPLQCTPEVYRAYSRRHWDTIVKGRTVRNERVAKARLKMVVPEGYADWDHRALACFWFCLHPQGERIPLFTIPVVGAFPQLEIFSMSAYLRCLTSDVISLNMSIVEERSDLMRLFLERTPS
jgi:hypothetical protein